jgi:methanogenic corrinoid protein MtbC1
MLISGAYERVVASLILPAMVRVGEEWAAGRLSVAAEHAATNAVARRLGAAFDGAAVDPAIEDAVVIGLPERSRHELGVLAFAVVARRAGLPVIYVGADLPSLDWLKAAATARAVVIAAPTAADRTSARRLAVALHSARPQLTVALGGRAAPHVDGCLQLSDLMEVAAAQLKTALG